MSVSKADQIEEMRLRHKKELECIEEDSEKELAEFVKKETEKSLQEIGLLKTPSVLNEAEEIINGARKKSYGPAKESFDKIGKMWSATISHKLKEDLTGEEVALMMIGLKVCREANKHQRDNLVDIGGYTALIEVMKNESK